MDGLAGWSSVGLRHGHEARAMSFSPNKMSCLTNVERQKETEIVERKTRSLTSSSELYCVCRSPFCLAGSVGFLFACCYVLCLFFVSLPSSHSFRALLTALRIAPPESDVLHHVLKEMASADERLETILVGGRQGGKDWDRERCAEEKSRTSREEELKIWFIIMF